MELQTADAQHFAGHFKRVAYRESYMKRFWILGVLVTCVGTTVAPASECIEDGQSVTFEGRVSRETFPGPPNYESIDDGDQPETVWILTLDSAQCVVGKSMEDGSPIEIAKSTTRFQLAFEDQSVYGAQKRLVEQRAIVNGQIFAGQSGHHHTKALVAVKRIKAANAGKAHSDVPAN
jgi:hypothetical protein